MRKFSYFLLMALILGIGAAAIVGFLLMNRNTSSNSSIINPAQLPDNGIHVSSYLLPDTDNIVRVEIVANIAQLAAGFDLSIVYDATAITPVTTSANAPATIGDLFADATSVRNIVTTTESSNFIRMMYVFFGQNVGAIGSGTLAIIDFEVQSDTQFTNITLENPRLSHINEVGVAEYIPLLMGDPIIEIQISPGGEIVPSIGQAPQLWPQLNVILLASIIAGIAACILAVMITWYLMNRHPQRRVSA